MGFSLLLKIIMLLKGRAGGIIQLPLLQMIGIITYILRSDPALGMIHRQRGLTMQFCPNILEHLHLTVARDEFPFTECYES